MVEIRKLHAEFVGSDGYGVRLRIPQRPKQVGPPPPRPGWKSRHQRFERRLKDFPPPTPQDTPCVLWQGAVDHYGYGSIKQYFPDGSRRTVKVHRWIMEMAEGRLLHPAETILHLCDNPPCFRVSHLRIGTIAENNADARAKGRASKPPINRLFGTANPNTKISPVERVNVFSKWMAGASMHALAAEYGVSSQRIHAICRIFRDDHRAWQAIFLDLMDEGHDPEVLCARMNVDSRSARWDLFQAVDLRSEAALAPLPEHNAAVKAPLPEV